MKVSIIIPVYNCEKYICECIDSVLAQDYPNMEVIAVDDGSTDSTPELLDTYADMITVFHQANKGAAGAINTGIELSEGYLVTWVGADDIYLPGRVSKLVRMFIERPAVGLIYTDYVTIDAEGKDIHAWQIPELTQELLPRQLIIHNFINAATVMVRRGAYNLVGGYDEEMGADCDGDMWFRMLKAGIKFARLPETTLKYRWHEENGSHNISYHHSCKDVVRAKAIDIFTAEELFPDKLENDHATAYANIVQLMNKLNMKLTAKAAWDKAMELSNIKQETVAV